MKIKGVEINFDTVETFKPKDADIFGTKECGIVFTFVSGKCLSISFDNQQNRDDVMFQIRLKLSKHE